MFHWTQYASVNINRLQVHQNRTTFIFLASSRGAKFFAHLNFNRRRRLRRQWSLFVNKNRPKWVLVIVLTISKYCNMHIVPIMLRINLKHTYVKQSKPKVKLILTLTFKPPPGASESKFLMSPYPKIFLCMYWICVPSFMLLLKSAQSLA